MYFQFAGHTIDQTFDAEMDDRDTAADYYFLGLSLLAQGNPCPAREKFEKSVASSTLSPYAPAAIGYVIDIDRSFGECPFTVGEEPVSQTTL